MKKESNKFNHKIGDKTFWYLLAMVFVMVGFLSFTIPSVFSRFLGNLNPILVFLLSGIIGFVCLSILNKKFGLSIYKRGIICTSLRHLWPALIFPLVAVLVDLFMVFPEDMNIYFPHSLLFYPAMAFLVEIFFHALPLSLLLLLLSFFMQETKPETLIWIGMFIVASLEPTFQVVADSYPPWAMVTTWINLFLFNLFQLFLFKKYGFIAMYGSRIMYYLIWHILWGYYRLEVLF